MAPIKELRIKQRTEPWISNDILRFISERDRAFHDYKKHRTDEKHSHFKTLQNNIQTLIFNAKRNYFKQKLEEEKDSKSLWRSLKDLGMPSKSCKNTASNIGLKIDGEVCFDKLSVAEKFNSFYTTVASKLVAKLPERVNKFGKRFVQSFYLNKGVVPNSYSFSLVSENMVLGYLKILVLRKLLDWIVYLHALLEMELQL